jgi:RES domain-containing protein
VRFQGKLFRALNPVYAREPLSGRGAALHGGRFNPKRVPALYASLSVLTALREANQVGDLQPTTLVSYEAEIENIFDTRDEDALLPFGMSASALADPGWRDAMKVSGKAPTQAFAETLISRGFDGLLVRSFAPGASEDDFNLVLWNRGGTPPSRLIPIDDEGRLNPRA